MNPIAQIFRDIEDLDLIDLCDMQECIHCQETRERYRDLKTKYLYSDKFNVTNKERMKYNQEISDLNSLLSSIGLKNNKLLSENTRLRKKLDILSEEFHGKIETARTA